VEEAARRHLLVARGRRFARIARGLEPGPRIILKNRRVTAFLDHKDPKSPDYDDSIFDWELASFADLKDLPLERRAHVLVIPNRGRAHVGRHFGSGLRASDLETSLRILREAEALARELGIQRARVFINPPDKVSVGYLHVHIVGERDPSLPYPDVSGSGTR
jgi:diadenosine tetraphosphate (Ap4A) HIT family hydrolase